MKKAQGERKLHIKLLEPQLNILKLYIKQITNNPLISNISVALYLQTLSFKEKILSFKR